eukprot:scaffold72208_cov63-Phaeocystis_antarctica.AAC.1
MAGRAVASILAAAKRHRPNNDDDPQFVGQRSWQERDAEARANTVDLTDSPGEPRLYSRIPGAASASGAADAAAVATAWAAAVAATAAAARGTAATAMATATAMARAAVAREASAAGAASAGFGDGHDNEGAAALAALSDSGDDEAVEFVGQRSWRERDDVARAAAVDIEHAPPTLRPELRPDHAASANRVKPEPARVKPEPPPPLASPLTQPAPSSVRPRVPPPLPAGFATAAPSPQQAPPLFDPTANLDPDQQRALAVALSGRSLFLTGGAGVGKSFTLRRIVGALQQRHGINAVAVTASTGTAS